MNARKTPISPSLAMNFKCSHEDEYIFNVAAWGFLFKLDLATESFSNSSTKCKELDP